MYSYEIQEQMNRYNYCLPAGVCLDIQLHSPQISHVKYDAWNNIFEMWTNDGYYWKFKVVPR